MGYIFDGTAKTVTLTSGTTTLDLIDLHSRWKDWLYSNNAGYSIAFRTIGGDIPAIPLYLFLLNGWRVVPQSANHTLTVVNGIFEVDGGGDPFVDPVGSYKIRINRETPGIAIGYNSTGSDPATIAAATWQHSTAIGLLGNVSFIRNIESGRWKIENNQMVFYNPDGVTPLASFALKDASGLPTMENPIERVPL
jgi:hypothetical protein